MMLRVLTKEAAVREAATAAAAKADTQLRGKQAGKMRLPTSYECLGLETGCALRLQRPCTAGLCKEQTVLLYHFWTFFKNGRWAPGQGTVNGHSWLELFARFQGIGGLLAISDLDDTALGPRASFRRMLLNFTRLAKAFLKIHCHPDDLGMFKPARCKEHRLLHYGINKHMPCIQAQLCLLPAGAELMHRMLLSLTGHGKEQHFRQAAAGNLRTKLQKVKMGTQPPWNHLKLVQVLPIAVTRRIKQDILANDNLGMITDGVAPHQFCHACPRCQADHDF